MLRAALDRRVNVLLEAPPAIGAQFDLCLVSWLGLLLSHGVIIQCRPFHSILSYLMTT